MPKKRAKSPAYAPERVEFCCELASRGMRPGQITSAVSRKWGVTRRTAEKDLAKARELLAWSLRQNAEEYAGALEAALWRVARKAEETGEFSAAVSAMRELSRLRGLGAARVAVEHSGGVKMTHTSTAEMTQQERISEYLALAKELEGAGAA